MNDSDLNSRMRNRFSSLYTQIQEYILKLGAGNYAQINVKLLGKAILDYFEDIERLKLYEGINRINEAKIYAYQSYWLLRRKPVQIINTSGIPDVGNYLNEYIIAFMLISSMYKEAGISISSPDPKRLSFLRLLIYNFKYREFTQKSLELMIEAFFLAI